MSRHYGAGDWEGITPLERQKNHDLAAFLYKPSLINRVQRVFLWPLDKVHAVLAEYMRFLLLKEELEDFYAHILAVPPIIGRVWECHIVDTADYRMCLEKVMGPGVFFDYNPDMMATLDEDFKEEKISQLQLFYRGMFGRDPEPFFWSFDPSSVAFTGGAAFQPPAPRFPRGGGGDEHAAGTAAIRRPVSASAHFPAGSGRFPRDISGTIRAARNDRPPRPTPGSPGNRPLNSRWINDDEVHNNNNDNDEGGEEVPIWKTTITARALNSEAGAGEERADSASRGSGNREPYLPNLENFIGNYHQRRQPPQQQLQQKQQHPTQHDGVRGELDSDRVRARGEAETRKRSAEHIRLRDEDSSAAPGPAAVCSAAATPAALDHPTSNKLITFVMKCKEPRLRLVMSDCCVDFTVGDLKRKIYELSFGALATDFTLNNLGKRIDVDEVKTLEEVGILEGDILTIQACGV